MEASRALPQNELQTSHPSTHCVYPDRWGSPSCTGRLLSCCKCHCRWPGPRSGGHAGGRGAALCCCGRWSCSGCLMHCSQHRAARAVHNCLAWGMQSKSTEIMHSGTLLLWACHTRLVEDDIVVSVRRTARMVTERCSALALAKCTCASHGKKQLPTSSNTCLLN